MLWPISFIGNLSILILSAGALFGATDWAFVGKAAAFFMVLSLAEGFLRGRATRAALAGYGTSPDEVRKGAIPASKKAEETETELDGITARMADRAEEALIASEGHLAKGELEPSAQAYGQFSHMLEMLHERGFGAAEAIRYLSMRNRCASMADAELLERLRSNARAHRAIR